MTEIRCLRTSDDQPRVVAGEHYDACEDDTCRGCWPCNAKHCGSCGVVHGTYAYPVTCVKCLDKTRENLDKIAGIARLVRDEADHSQVNSRAALLVGPTANPEAWGHRALSAMRGRIEDAWLEDCRDEQHPLWVLGTWSDVWREHLDQPTSRRVTVKRAWAYLNEHLTHMAQQVEPDFAQFSGEVRGCLTFMRNVVHDQAKGDPANVSCFDCGGQLERLLKDRKNGGPTDDRGGFEDHWTCKKCHRKYKYAEYNFALRAKLEAKQREESA